MENKNIPLNVRLKREVHRKIAYAQDLVVKEVYNIFSNAVLHGGTAIWRCYNGKRFSEDLDFYFTKDKEKFNILFENLSKIGFKIIKKKISNTSIYSELEFERTTIRIEATFQNIKGAIYDYEMSDGNFMIIYTLTPEQFIVEKSNTYLKRFKIRDLWDVFFLLKNTKDISRLKEIKKLIDEYKKPEDEDNLKAILLEGIVPTSKEMIEYIRRKWENKYI